MSCAAVRGVAGVARLARSYSSRFRASVSVLKTGMSDGRPPVVAAASLAAFTLSAVGGISSSRSRTGRRRMRFCVVATMRFVDIKTNTPAGKFHVIGTKNTADPLIIHFWYFWKVLVPATKFEVFVDSNCAALATSVSMDPKSSVFVSMMAAVNIGKSAYGSARAKLSSQSGASIAKPLKTSGCVAKPRIAAKAVMYKGIWKQMRFQVPFSMKNLPCFC
mmetsp:Transcript_100504/g.178323  ORF Transcript_100504/g.178323 Transcript_100504/m.178323 type:complete len:219 (-) Transcript_100504:363-1019(-)